MGVQTSVCTIFSSILNPTYLPSNTTFRGKKPRKENGTQVWKRRTLGCFGVKELSLIVVVFSYCPEVQGTTSDWPWSDQTTGLWTERGGHTHGLIPSYCDFPLSGPRLHSEEPKLKVERRRVDTLELMQ